MFDRFKCTTDNYNLLYARYLERSGTLLDMCGWTPGMDLLDLCGGTGAVSTVAMKRGAPFNSVTLMDLNPRCKTPGVHQLNVDVNRMFMDESARDWCCRFDRIVCRQAMAYLNLRGHEGEALVSWLAAMLKPGGSLAFNLFYWPKTAKVGRWFHKKYEHYGVEYREFALRFLSRVYHIQYSPSFGADFTSFFAYENRDLKVFRRHFHCEVEVSGVSQRWICLKK